MNPVPLKECNHVWRIFGNYAHEEVYPVLINHGYIQCIECGKNGFANEYKVIKKISPVFPKLVCCGLPTCDRIVEIIKP